MKYDLSYVEKKFLRIYVNDETFVTRSLKKQSVRKCITYYTLILICENAKRTLFIRKLQRGQFVLGRNLSQLQVHTDNESTFDGSLSQLIVAIVGASLLDIHCQQSRLAETSSFYLLNFFAHRLTTMSGSISVGAVSRNFYIV